MMKKFLTLKKTILYLICSVGVHAADLIVTTTADEPSLGELTLREAIFQAQPGDTILFNSVLDGGVVQLSQGELLIDKELTIDASDLSKGLIIDGGSNGDFILDEGESRCFLISNEAVDPSSDNDLPVVLNNLTIRRGAVLGTLNGGNIRNRENLTLNNCRILDGRAYRGGGIFSRTGALILNDCSISGNETQAEMGIGGGICSVGNNLTLSRCEISHNQTQGDQADGGGIYSLLATVILNNCTISQNKTQGSEAQGGGISSILNNLILANCTISDNKIEDERFTGGGVFVRDDLRRIVEVENCIISGNTSTDFAVVGNLTEPLSRGGNLIGISNVIDQFTGTKDQTGITNPLLGALGQYGGPTRTMHPLVGSPVINAGRVNLRTTDQRGVVITDGLPDIGAVEVGSVNVVKNRDDSGVGSLRQALADADSDFSSFITFAPSLNGNKIRLESELVIDKPLFVDASGLSRGITISGGSDHDFELDDGETRCFLISDGDDENDLEVFLTNLTIQKGVFEGDAAGANIHNRENLTLNHCHILDGRAFGGTGNADGGGIYSQGGMITLTACLVSRNQTKGLDADGGGIFSFRGKTAMTDCTISHNQTLGEEGRGGGVLSASSALTMNSCTIARNQTHGERAVGAGVLSNTDLTGVTALFNNCTFGNNRAFKSQGGGLYNEDGRARLVHCTFSENEAIAGSGIFSGEGNFTLTELENSVVAGNISTDLDSLTTDNSFVSNGGNVFGSGNTLAQFRKTNDKSGITDPLLTPLSFYGGPTQTMHPLTGSPVAGAASTSSTRVFDQRGFEDFDGFSDSGAVESGRVRIVQNLRDSGTESLRDLISKSEPFTVLRFRPVLNGGILELASELIIDKDLFIDASELSDGITIDGGSNSDFVLDSGETRCLVISDGDDEKTLSVYMNNITVQNGVFEGRDAGANIHSCENLTLDHCQILNGRAFRQDGDADGGGIYQKKGSLFLSNCLVSQNQTRGDGSDGGGIGNFWADLFLTHCTISQNQTEGSFAEGGGIHNVSGNLTLIACTVSQNQTQGRAADGGGINMSSGDLRLSSCTFSQNEAHGSSSDGGGVHSNADLNGDIAFLNNCTFTGNRAIDSDGGGFYNHDGFALLTHCTFSENHAQAGKGGGLSSDDDDRTRTVLKNCIVAGNSGSDLDTTTTRFNSFFSNGGNIIGTGNALAVFNQTGDQTGVSDPFLTPLGDFGGPTRTMVPLPSSAAINATNASVRSVDQRDATIIDDQPDSGAVELGPITIVQNADDSGAGSLRQAIADAIGNTPAITFASSLDGNTIQLASELLIDKTLLIDANNLSNGIIVNGGSNGDFVRDSGETRCFLITDGNDDNDLPVSLSNLTVRNGVFLGDKAGANIHNRENLFLKDCRILNGRAFGGGSSFGGGLFSEEGSLILVRCLVSGNQSDGLFGGGGGIASLSNNTILVNSTVSENQTNGIVGSGGGIYSASNSLTLTACTISGNQTQGGNASGGGIFSLFADLTLNGCAIVQNQTQGPISQGGGVFYSAKLAENQAILTNCTFSGNQTVSSNGGGFANFEGLVRLIHCTFSGNQAGGEGASGIISESFNPTVTEIEDCIVSGNFGSDLDFGGATNTFRSVGGNLIGTGNALGTFVEADDRTGITDPRLAPLGDYGGPTQTMLPLLSSPAINGASNSLRLVDQRGLFVNDTPDIGAVEHQGVSDILLIPETITNAEWAADIDNDGNNLLLEVALGTDPFSDDRNDPRNPVIKRDGTFSFGPNPAAANVVNWFVETTTTLQPDDFVRTQLTLDDLNNLDVAGLLQVTNPTPLLPQRFFRIVVELKELGL